MPSLVDPVLLPDALSSGAQPELRGEGLLLRPWDRDDALVLVGAYADPDIRRWHSQSMTLAEAEAWIETRHSRWASDAGADWAVTEYGEVVGRAGLNRLDLDEGRAELAYWVLPSGRGAGVAARATRTLTAWAFGELGLNRIELLHSTANDASCRVAERAGYALEGTKRRDLRHADGWHDMHLHARVAGD